MNSPMMQGLNLNLPPYVKNARLIAWVADMAALCKPDSIHWCDGSDEEYDRLCQKLVDGGHAAQARPAQAAQLLPGMVRSERRGAGRGPHLHLLAAQGRCRADQQLDGPPGDARHAGAALRRLHARTHDVCGAVLDGSAGLAHLARRHRAVRQPLRRRQHEDHDAHGQGRVRRAGRRGRFRAVRAHGGRPPGTWPARRGVAVQQDQVHRPLPRDPRDLVLRLRLRRQRAAGQEVLCPAHCLHDGARPGLAGRAHAADGRHHARRQEVPRRGGLSLGLRQDQFRDADPAQGLRRLEGHHHRRRHRLDQAARGRQALRHQSGSRLFRRGAGHESRDQPELHGHARAGRDLHQRRADRRRRRVVGGPGACARARAGLAGQGLDARRSRARPAPRRPTRMHASRSRP